MPKRYELRDKFIKLNALVTEPTVFEVPDDENIVNVSIINSRLGLGVEVLTIKELPKAHKD